MYIFTIWDNREQKFYAKNDRALWLSKKAAIDALMFNYRDTNRINYIKNFTREEVASTWLNAPKDNQYLTFAEQNRFECRKYCLKESEYEIVRN